jgi:hypothetical protein
MIPATLNCMKKHPNFKMPFYTIVTWLGVQHFVRTNVGIIQRNKNVTHSQYLVFYIYKTSVLEGPELPCRFQYCNPLLVLLKPFLQLQNLCMTLNQNQKRFVATTHMANQLFSTQSACLQIWLLM